MKNWIPVLAVALLAITSCSDNEDQTTDLELTFQAMYDGQPLVITDKYEYEQVARLFFDKVRFYLSDLDLISNDGNLIRLADIAELDFTNANSDAAGAARGISFIFNELPTGTYQGMALNIGLTTEQNALSPADYPVDHPLSNTDPYWSDWQSYIFTTFSGRADYDSDEQFETGFVYHIGGDETLRRKSFPTNFSLTGGQTGQLKVQIDLKDVFVSNQGVFDIQATPQVHTDKPVMNQMADALIAAFYLIVE